MIIIFFEIIPIFVLFFIAGLTFLLGIGLMGIVEWILSHLVIIAIILAIKSICAGLVMKSYFAIPFDFLRSCMVLWLIVQQIYSWGAYDSIFELILILPFDLLGVGLIIAVSLYVLAVCESLPTLGEIASLVVLFLLIYILIYKASGGWERPLDINKYIPIIKNLQEVGISYSPIIL